MTTSFTIDKKCFVQNQILLNTVKPCRKLLNFVYRRASSDVFSFLAGTGQDILNILNKLSLHSNSVADLALMN